MAAAHPGNDEHDDHSDHGGHDDHAGKHHAAVEEDSVRTPMWLPFVGIALLLFGAVYTYSVMHEPPSAAELAAAAADGGGSDASASAAPAAPAPTPAH